MISIPFSFVFLWKKKKEREKSKPHTLLIPETNHMHTMHVDSIFIEKFNETRQISSYTRHILQRVPIPFYFQFCAASLSSPSSSSSSSKRKKNTHTMNTLVWHTYCLFSQERKKKKKRPSGNKMEYGWFITMVKQ